MDKKQEYIKFWISIINKIQEIEKDYNNLSEENKRRVDEVKDAVLRAHTYADTIKILYEQLK